MDRLFLHLNIKPFKIIMMTAMNTMKSSGNALFHLIKKGWIVPLMLGFKGISPLYPPEQVENLRDHRYPFRFVEAIHGLGEWKSSHRIDDIQSLIWRYDCRDEWYLCRQNRKSSNRF